MSFRQVYYTSCEAGLRGSKGFQINAASDGIDPSILQQIERLGLYIPPVSAPSRPSQAEIEQFPLCLLFHRLGNGDAVLAQAKYTGTDYSGRFGNYFTHSLISETPESDLNRKKLLPIEMWRSMSWSTTPSTSTSLPAIGDLHTGDAIDPLQVHDFLNEQGRMAHLPAFLTAVEGALNTGRRVLIVADNHEVAMWIAVASYALPYHMVMRLTFNTYVKNPYQTESLIVGTTEDSDFSFAQHEIEHQYYVFDFKGNRFTSISQPSNFALKVAATYQSGRSEDVARFALFIERRAPELTLEELDSAFASYAFIGGFEAPETTLAKVLSWCAGYLNQFDPEELRDLFSLAMRKGAQRDEIVEACTDFYLAATGDSTQPTMRNMIELPYLNWLVQEVITVASFSTLKQTAIRLKVNPATFTEIKQNRSLWVKQVRNSKEHARQLLLFIIGAKLGFLEEPDVSLRLIGQEVLGPGLDDSNVQEIVKLFINKPAMADAVEGICVYLTSRLGDVRAFQPLAGLFLHPAIFNSMIACAVEQQSIGLFFRLVGTRGNTVNAEPDSRIKAFDECLRGATQFVNVLTPQLVDNAYDAVWQNYAPTLDEALQLLSPPLLQQVLGTGIPRRLVTLLEGFDLFLTEPKQKELLARLWPESVYSTLEDKKIQVFAYRIPVELERSGDAIATELDVMIDWLGQSHKKLSGHVGDQLYELIAQYLVTQVKEVELHCNLLLKASKSLGSKFLDGYAKSVSALLNKRSDLRPKIAARLILIWVSAAQLNSRKPASMMFSEVLPTALSDWRPKELDAVDGYLEDNPSAYKIWIKHKDNYGSKGAVERIKGWFSKG